MSKPCCSFNFLITGVAGDIGMGIGRILKEVYSGSTLIGIDANPDNPALAIYNYFFQSPLASQNDYKSFIESIVERHNINVIIPTSEAEISAFWGLGLVDFFLAKNIRVIILDQHIINVSLDKFKTTKYLEESNIPYAKTSLASDVQLLTSFDFPIIYKPRSGQGSKNVIKISSPKDLESLLLTDEFIFQEYLGSTEKEYTCSVVGAAGVYRVLILHRKLSGGFTVSGKVVFDESIERYVLSLAEKLELNGSINIQLRITERGPVLFEINPRFSSTVVFRHKLGFKDLVWTIEGYDKSFKNQYSLPTEGTKFFRGVSEYVFGEDDAN